MAVANAVLQGNAPLPACAAGGGAGIGRQDLGRNTGYGNGPVTRQPVGPILKAGFQSAFNEQSAEARAVNEKATLNLLTIF